MKKRILSCFMALALSLTLLPATAQAEEGESVTEPHTHSDWLASGYGTDGKTLVLRAGGDDNIYGDTLEKPNDGDWILPAGNYYLQDDITVEYAIAISGDVTICLNGRTLESKGENMPVFRVEDGSTLTLTDCKGNAGKVKHTSDGSGSGVRVEGGGTFNMYGGTITQNTAEYGGGVGVTGGNSKFNMYGGTISGNKATKGGGVYVSAGATFTMNGNASVTGNNATGSTGKDNMGTGGGVYVSDGTFTMNGGTISGNTADLTDGGVGVYTTTASTTATFTMNGGEITRNKASSQGGGVGVYRAAKFEMNNSASVKDNTANQGGGVYMDNKGVRMDGATFTMNNTASVKDNTAKNGGGVYVESGTFNMNDGTISGNKAKNDKASNDTNGGGVFVNKSGTFNMNDGAISGNEATNTETANTTYGGGVYVSGGTFTMNGKTTSVSNNTATNGGGVYASSGTFTMNDGRITGNHNNGVFVHDSATFTVSRTPTVTGNTNTTNSAASNVYLMGRAYITIGNQGLQGSTESIGVTKVVDPRTEKAVIATNVSTDCSGKFFSDDTQQYVVKYDEPNSQLVLKMVETPTPEHTHSWTYSIKEGTTNTIVATCANTDKLCNATNGGSVTIKASTTTYDSTEKPATVEKSGNWESAFSKSIPITYEQKNGDTYTSMKGGVPTEVGKYKASITVGGQTAFVEYEITGSTPEIVPVDSITLNTTTATLEVGKTTTLTATVTPENAANKDLKWASSDTSVATVAADGTVTAVKAGTATITATAADGSGKSATCTVTVTGGTTPSQPGGSTGGSSSDRDSSDSNPIIKTETKNNADGSTTKTETRRDGSVTQTTTAKDGSVSKTETKKDGSSVTENKAADGSTGTVKTDKHGQTEAKTALSNKAIEDAKKNGEAVKAPVEVEASRNSSTAPTVKVELPKGAGETKVEIPVSNVKSGTVAVLVHPDGTEEIVKNSVPTENGIQLTVDGSATVKIVDNSKGFIDIRDHWAEDEIDFVSARGLVNGMSATIYAPNNSTTRAQLWTILARQNDADLSGGNTWYESAQNWAKAKGISDGANPNAAINRAQMVTMLWRAVGQPAAGGAASFTDVSADTYYAGAVSWAVENGITTGVGNGKFNPTGTCTRAQIAAFLARLYAEK